ncbi:cellulose synthase-like protein G1 [Cornus florida]|uniref:cellulose synthase-like protein G1 n=1 Tax=Cornus florida TaxID=4283 RepID=UPI00289C5CEB|nr:cellulose synthase-like protein G1 [Cornus florida]
MAMTKTTSSDHLLHTTTVQQLRTTINRAHILFHSILISFLLYYRLSRLFNPPIDDDFPSTAWVFMFVSELIISFIWLFTQSFRWRLVLRSVSPERLPGDKALPGVDVFICTADRKKEPTLEVMNTVISAMSLDYPPEKLAVYLSDDGGDRVTMKAMEEAAAFARRWVPFCRKYGIKTRCPEAYFSVFADDDLSIRGAKFQVEEENIKTRYEQFKKCLESGGDDGFCTENVNTISVNGRPPVIRVIHDSRENEDDDNAAKLPLLVYVSREKRPSYPHRFKAGALNTLLRVSGVFTNSPYILVLDCDMYCNDPTSARQAMCFHIDANKSSSLAFVQFPQIFYNVSKNDIYDAQARSAYKTKWQGMDGLRGPLLCGTGFYLKRMALYASPTQEDSFLLQPKVSFGISDKFIASLRGNNGQYIFKKGESSSDELLKEAHFLATCAFEKGTKWGSEIGFSYECLLESTFTGYLLHCKGWTSVYCYPKRPSFLGCTTIDMKDAMVQLRKWTAGLFQIGISKFSPLTYAMSRMSIIQSMCYGYFTFHPLFSLAFLIYGVVPQLCFYKGISLYPKVTDPWFLVFSIVWASSLLQHLYEVVSSGGSLRTWWNEQRIWMVKSVTATLFGCLDVFMKWIGVTGTVFRLTNKVIDKQKLEKYKNGKFDFSGAELFMVPLVMLVTWNIACFMGGVRKMLFEGGFNEMFGQCFLSFFIIALSYPIIGGLVKKNRKERRKKK